MAPTALVLLAALGVAGDQELEELITCHIGGAGAHGEGCDAISMVQRSFTIYRQASADALTPPQPRSELSADALTPSQPRSELRLGQEDPTVDVNFQTDQSDEWEGRHKELSRPSWQKTLRCTDSEADDGGCEECYEPLGTGPDPEPASNCWSYLHERGTPARFVRWNGTGKHTLFVDTIHVHCAERFLNIHWRVSSVKDGALTMFWDDTELSDANIYPTSAASNIEYLDCRDRKRKDKCVQMLRDKGHASNLPIRAGSGGEAYSEAYNMAVQVDLGDNKAAHEFRLEFRASAPGAEAQVTRLEFEMAEEFAKCEDKTVCLEKLDEEGDEGMQLRNSNVEQLRCLEAATPSLVSSACEVWVQCLEGKSDTKAKLLSMLRAAGVRDANSEVALVAMGAGRRHWRTRPASRATEFLDPELEDPESWLCDCYETAAARCAEIKDSVRGYEEDVCLRAQYCDHKDTCESWKEKFCTEELEPLRQALAATKEAALLQQRGAKAKAALQSLDASLGDKHCA